MLGPPRREFCRQEPVHARILSENAADPLLESADFVGACAVDMHMDVWQEQFYTRICRKNVAPQDHDHHFARACAIEMRISHEPFFARIYRKNDGAQNRSPRFAPAYAIKLRMDISQQPFYARIYRKKSGGQEQGEVAAQTLCQPAQPKFTLTSHKSKLLREFAGKMRGLESVPWSNPGLNPYRKNPSVWTIFLGNQIVPLRSSAEFKVNALKHYLKMMFNFNWVNIRALQRVNGCCTKFHPKWGARMVRMLQFMFSVALDVWGAK